MMMLTIMTLMQIIVKTIMQIMARINKSQTMAIKRIMHKRTKRIKVENIDKKRIKISLFDDFLSSSLY